MVTKEDVINVARLSKLFVDEDELEGLVKDMSDIVNFADEINKAGLTDTKFDNISNLSNVLRDDTVKESFDRELILKNADGGRNGFFYIKSHK